jgi:3-methyladenine DNA glycosylase AlkD
MSPAMTFAEVMQALEAAGSEQTRKTYRRHGAKDPMFGVSFAVLGQLKKKIKFDHALARKLWATGNVDARNLATMIADPQVVTAAELDRWSADDAISTITGLLARNLVIHTPFAREKAFAWVRSSKEWVAQTGWMVITAGAEKPGLFADDELLALLPQIEVRIHQEKNWIRDAMNRAVIAIGVRNAACQKAAIAAARRIGKVEVDHGDTDCKTPDAVAYITKTVAKRAAKQPRRTS